MDKIQVRNYGYLNFYLFPIILSVYVIIISQ